MNKRHMCILMSGIIVVALSYLLYSRTRSSIRYAVVQGDAKAVQLLIAENRNSDIEQKDNAGNTLLHHAAKHGHLEVVNVLLSEGADDNARNHDGKKPADLAVMAGHQDIAELLDVYQLCKAVSSDDIKTADRLLDAGVPVDGRVYYGRRPLDFAVLNGSTESVTLLLSRGSQPSMHTAFMMDRWLASKLEGQMNNSLSGDTTLILAARTGNIGVLRQLLTHGADMTAANAHGETALHIAVRAGKADIVKELLDAGLDADIRTGKGSSALFGAAKYDRPKILEILISRGANPNLRNSAGNTPLHIASAWGALANARVLVEKGADINQRNQEGETPLFRALLYKHPDTAEYLLQQGADLDIPNNSEVSSRKLALKMGYASLLQIADGRAKRKQ